MILNKRENLLLLTDVKYHGRIGYQDNQMVVLVRKRSRLMVTLGRPTLGVGVTGVTRPTYDLFVQFIFKVPIFHLNFFGHFYHKSFYHRVRQVNNYVRCLDLMPLKRMARQMHRSPHWRIRTSKVFLKLLHLHVRLEVCTPPRVPVLISKYQLIR